MAHDTLDYGLLIMYWLVGTPPKDWNLFKLQVKVRHDGAELPLQNTWPDHHVSIFECQGERAKLLVQWLMPLPQSVTVLDWGSWRAESTTVKIRFDRRTTIILKCLACVGQYLGVAWARTARWHFHVSL